MSDLNPIRVGGEWFMSRRANPQEALALDEQAFGPRDENGQHNKVRCESCGQWDVLDRMEDGFYDGLRVRWAHKAGLCLPTPKEQ